MDDLVMVIALMCNFQSKTLTDDQKMDCAEKVVNCIGKNIGKDNVVTEKILNKCQPSGKVKL